MRKMNTLRNVNVVSIQLVKEKSLAYGSKQINSPKDAALIAGEFLVGADREHFVVLCMDTKHNVNALNTVSVGTLNSSLVHPREVFKAAVLANSNSIILIHNHPSGDPTPSREDLEITKRLVEAGSILGIEVMDHVVIGDNGNYVSLKERGEIQPDNVSR
ncbi:DNA repair protein RadC [Desulfosporosinus sp. I2]|uniref:JAB domain-containing protein n=1 Tax=Desulfosporosinus sp. I2 TaxID=1617025 RepID=UPI0005EF4B82|nr:DNA repair protein RadC [Desulfosporosinus sp. I2]KJR48416.1 DNA repair protein RadC [Desulfosporosinus sp. I2]